MESIQRPHDKSLNLTRTRVGQHAIKHGPTRRGTLCLLKERLVAAPRASCSTSARWFSIVCRSLETLK
jgi:hypothetical protein